MGAAQFFPTRHLAKSRESSREETRRRKRTFGRALATSLTLLFSLDEKSRPSASRTGREIRDRLLESFVDEADPRRRQKTSTLTIASSDGGRLKTQLLVLKAQPVVLKALLVVLNAKPAKKRKKTQVAAHLRS